MKGKYLTILFLGLVSFYHGYSEVISRRDSLENMLSESNLEVNKKIDFLNELSWEYLEVNPKKAQDLANEAISLLDKEKNSNQLVVAYQRLGFALLNRNKLDSAGIAFNTALKIGSDDVKILGAIYQGIGNVEADKGNYESSLASYLNALGIFEKANDLANSAKTLSSMGALYINLRNYDKMYEYTTKALEYHRKAGVKMGIAANLANLSEYYFQKNDTAKIFETITESQKLFHELKATVNEANVLSSLGDYYALYKNRVDKAVEIYKQALSLLSTKDHNNLRMDFYRKMALAYYQKPDYKSALDAMNKAVEYTDSTNNDYQRVNYYYLVYIYIGLKDVAKATESLDKYVEFSELVYKENQKKSIAEMDVKYQTEKKELKITSLEKERKLIVLISILVGVLLISFIVLIAVRQKILANQKRLAEQQIIQLQQEKQLIATQSLLEGETTERVRLSKDLHDGLGGLLSVTKHKIANMKGNLTIPADQIEIFNSALEMLDNSISELRRVAHNLMPESLMRYGLNSAISDFCNSIDKAKYHFYGLEKRLDDKLEVAAFRIVSELVNNALKHANAANINVQLVQEEDRVSITVHDDGCGFDTKAIAMGRSGGLKNIESRVISFNGRLDILSTPGKGTEISVEFKV